MGQKVSPVGLRVGINRDWDASWYADKTKVADLLQEDLKIRAYLDEVYAKAAVSRVVIERFKSNKKDRVKITIFTARPGMVIGKAKKDDDKAPAKAVEAAPQVEEVQETQPAEAKKPVAAKKPAVKELDKVKKELAYMTKKEIIINVEGVKYADLEATLVARSIADQLENRASFRRAQKMAISKVMKSGAKGVKTLISGRLGGAEMARSEGYNEGQVPLQTLRADVDYAVAEAHTTYGKLGVKVWIYRGEVFGITPKNFETNKRPNNNNKKPSPKKPAAEAVAKEVK